tara:strand:+ start:499 stop:792 length:294 start_codon:yes stop_codon:yes gene_type:complete
MAITIKHLENKIRILNESTNNPVETWTQSDVPNVYDLKSNIGNYHVAEEYGVFNLYQISNENGGVHQLFYGKTKRELYLQITAMLEGVGIGKSLTSD